MKCERCGAWAFQYPAVNTPSGYLCRYCAENFCKCDECEMIGNCSAETLPEQERLESCHLVFFWTEEDEHAD
jgi:hypothetical protein